jgi:predicted RNA-binding protein with PIN domain
MTRTKAYSGSPVRWIVDAMNVIGSRPDGWWRDREGAVRRLHGALAAFVRDGGEEVVLVLDAPVAGLLERSPAGLTVLAAPRPRPNAADDEIVRLVEADPDPGRLHVATSDAALAERVRGLGASVEGARAFRSRLEDLTSGIG